MKTASEVKNEVTKDIHISILKDTLKDLREANQMFKRVVYILCFIVILSICGMVGVGVYYQHRLFTFIESTDFNSEVNMLNEQSNSNNMNIRR